MMASEDFLLQRAFRGLLLDAGIRRFEEAGILETPPAPGRPFSLGEFEEYVPKRLIERAERMAYIYALTYCFENLVRELVAQRLLERLGSKWWNEVPEKVQRQVRIRREDAEKNKWHMAQVEGNIDYSLFGDLASIIVTHWREFEDLFPSQEWVKQRLSELERSRNVIAHANMLADSEIERIEAYVRDWLRQVP